MPVIDYVIIAVVLVSGIIGLVRGLIREAISLGTWVVAIWVVYMFAGDVAEMFSTRVESPVVRVLIAGAALFIAVLLLGALLGYIATVMVRTTGLSGTDRTLGMVFGGLRGIILLALLLVAAVSLLPVAEEAWWNESTLIPYVEQVVVWLRDLLPPELAEYLDYDPSPVESPSEAPAIEPET